METGVLPYETLVLVCTNKRAPGERAGCASHGRCGDALRDRLKEEAARRGLKGKVRVSASGCLDVCEDGPNVVVSPPSGAKIWLKNVSEADAPAILDRITKGE
jgi:(2Fe-2S) ferredoxin